MRIHKNSRKRTKKRKKIRNKLRLAAQKNYEGFSYGPITVERQGREIYLSSDWDERDFNKHMKIIKNERPRIKKLINNKIEELLEIIKTFDPLQLIKVINKYTKDYEFNFPLYTIFLVFYICMCVEVFIGVYERYHKLGRSRVSRWSIRQRIEEIQLLEQIFFQLIHRQN